MKNWTKMQLRRGRIFTIINSDKRNKYLKKHHIFKEMGENVFFQPRLIPADPHLIIFHNNIIVTSNVSFVNHDIFYLGLNKMARGKFPYEQSCIEVMDNVFIGCNSTILGNVRIGPNAVIGAGSIITKDVEPNTVVAGNPAVVIGSFADFIKKRQNKDEIKNEDLLWRLFMDEKNNKN